MILCFFPSSLTMVAEITSIEPLGQLISHMPHPVHLSASNDGLKVFLSTYIAPVGHALTHSAATVVSCAFTARARHVRSRPGTRCCPSATARSSSSGRRLHHRAASGKVSGHAARSHRRTRGHHRAVPRGPLRLLRHRPARAPGQRPAARDRAERAGDGRLHPAGPDRRRRVPLRGRLHRGL